MKNKYLLILLLLLLPAHFVWGQFRPKSGIDLFVGYERVLRVEARDDYKSGAELIIRGNRAMVFGAGYYRAWDYHIGLDLAGGFHVQQAHYQIRTLYRADVFAEFTAWSISLRPAIVIHPFKTNGLFLRFGIPVALKLGANGRLITDGFYNGVNYNQDLSDDINAYRNTAVAAWELGIGYIFPIREKNALWLRGSVSNSISNFWNLRNPALASDQGFLALGITAGFRFGNAKQQFDLPVRNRTRPSLGQRMKNQPWIND